MQDARVPRNDIFMDDGFLYVTDLKMGAAAKFRTDGYRVPKDQSVFIVQSASTGELFVNKLIERPWYADRGISLPPLELRASTYPHAVGDPNIDLPGGRKGVLPDVPYFNTLRFWQELDPSDDSLDCTVYSLFFE